jgi:hypothetical protein
MRTYRAGPFRICAGAGAQAMIVEARGLLVVVLSALVLVTVCARARAADARAIDCALVRAMVAEHGKARAIAWAIENGYGWRHIRAARRCLTEGRG